MSVVLLRRSESHGDDLEEFPWCNFHPVILETRNRSQEARQPAWPNGTVVLKPCQSPYRQYGGLCVAPPGLS